MDIRDPASKPDAMRPTTRPGQTVVIAIMAGQFVRWDDFKYSSYPLTVEGVVQLLRAVDFDPLHDHVYCSSSVDFPEDDGAPDGFDGRATIEEAVALLEGGLSGPTFYPPCVPRPEQRKPGGRDD